MTRKLPYDDWREHGPTYFVEMRGSKSLSSDTDYSETVMRHVFLALTTLIVASGGNTAFAQYDCPGGQRPVPPPVAEQMVLPPRGSHATTLAPSTRLHVS